MYLVAPSPCLFGLIEHCEGGVVEAGQENKIYDIADAGVHLDRQVEDETWRIWYVPAPC